MIKGTNFIKYKPILSSIEKVSDPNKTGVVFPNPTTGPITIEFCEWKVACYIFSLFDINGKLLIKKIMTSNLFHINLQENSPGIYIYQINVGNNIQYGEIIKK